VLSRTACALPPTGPDVALELRHGLGAPSGLMGLGLVVTPWRHLSLEGGLGYDLGGPRLALGARARLPLANRGVRPTLALGGGLFGGPFSDVDGIEGPASTSGVLLTWANAEASLELSLGDRTRFRLLYGWRALLNPDRVRCGEGARTRGCSDLGEREAFAPYVGVALGYML